MMSKYRAGQSVRYNDGRAGELVRRNRPYAQWLVELPDKRLTWWWEADFTEVE